MADHRAFILQEYQLKQLEKVIFEEPGAPGRAGSINRRWIGKNAGTILREIGDRESRSSSSASSRSS